MTERMIPLSDQEQDRVFCEICGLHEDDHPKPPPPGPPDVPPRHYDGVWRQPHAFTPSRFSLSELLDERDAQIKLWRARAYKAERKLDQARRFLASDPSTPKENPNE